MSNVALRQINKVSACAAAAVAGLLLAACGGGGGGEFQVERQSTGEVAPNVVQPGAPGQPARTLSAEDLAKLPTETHTEVDVRFMQGMIHHHAQALRMTALVPRRSSSRQIERLARRIDVTQEAEIDQMRRWLTARDQPAPTLHRLHGHAHGIGVARMPGMLSDAQLRTLERARGAAFDRLFLRFMIQHHRGALVMVERLYAQNGGLESEADAFARGVDADQLIEIARMEDLLARRSS
jgi:uncharacterized protein (DUF305 family)